MPNYLYWNYERTKEAIKLWIELGSSESAAKVMGVTGNRLRGHLIDVKIKVPELQKIKSGELDVEALLAPFYGRPAQPKLEVVKEAVPAKPEAPPVVPADVGVVERPTATGNVSPLILVIPDIHAPQQDNAAFGAVLAMMVDHKFKELILLGDACEFVSLSWFGGPSAMRPYKDEALEARAVLKQILALHAGPVTLVKGNHDNRPDQKVEKMAPQIHGSIKDEVGFEELGITLIPEDKQPIVRGKISFIHGHQDTGKFPALYHSRKMADLYGLPASAVVYGHTHKDQTFSRPMHGGPARAYGLGCLERRPDWLKGAESWTHSIATADPLTGSVQVLPICGGVLWYGSQRYSAK